ncbi:MAG TPA: Ig-like domain repeat protein [Terriglobia bacterium]|nr:Ig-like domain repeat protein [Terriglobia bacterium]
MDQGACVTRRRRGALLFLSFEIATAFAFVVLLASNGNAQSARVRARIVQPVKMSRLVTLRGNTPLFAHRQYDRGAAPDNLALDRMLLVLKRGPEQESALRQLLVQQQVKSSPNYHQWLTPEDFGREFGPADADIQTLRGWLSSQGFQVGGVAAGRSVIEFSGTAALVRQAFRTEIHQFEVEDKAYWSNAGDPQIPAALAPVVAGIASLNNFPIRPMSHTFGTIVRSRLSRGVNPLYTYTGTDGKTYHPLGPGDFSTIYNVQPLWSAGIDGSGETIAIVAESNIDLKDVENFRTLFGLPANDPQIILNGPDPGIIKGPEGEADLDTEWAGAVAKNATIDLVVSESTTASQGIDLSALYIVDNNLAPVMSVSYGFCEASLGAAGNAFYNSLWEQAAAQGITVVVAAGDSGSAGCDYGESGTAEHGLAVSGVASTPFDVAVGGTDFDDVSSASQYWSSTNDPSLKSSALSYVPETAWNDSCARTATTNCPSDPTGQFFMLAGGGGPSTCGNLTGTDPNAVCQKGYAKPAWQSGPGVRDDSSRDTPDVSLFSGTGLNQSFYFFCEADADLDSSSLCDLTNGSEIQAVGGTSTSAQAFAGIMALLDQKMGQRQGNANYILYTLAAQPGASCASNSSAVHNTSCIFYDVVTGDNSLPCTAESPACGPAPAGGSGVLMMPGSTTVPAWTTGPGYDLATGLGSVNAANLVNKWPSASFTPSSTQLSLSPTSLTHGQPVDANVQVTAESGTPAGAVSLLAGPNGNVSIAHLTLSGGVGSGTTTNLPGGTYNITAHYAGDAGIGASDSNPVQVTVGKEDSQTRLGIIAFGPGGSPNATTMAYGSPYVLDVDVANAAGTACTVGAVPASACPTGTVNLTDNGAPLDLGTYALNSIGQIEDQPIQLAPGSHNLAAAYSGDNSFNGSTSSPDAVTVTQAVTTTTLTTSSSSVQAGGSVTLTAIVNTTSNGAAPSGTVQFLSGSTPVNGAVSYSPTPGPLIAAQLKATLSIAPPATTTITAVYQGDANYSGSSSTPQTVTVLPGFDLALDPATLTISAPGQAGNISVKLVPGGGFTGTVTFGCQIPAAMKEASCKFTPPALTASGQTQLAIATTAPHTAAALFGPSGWFWGCGAGLLLCLLVLGISTPYRRYNRVVVACLLILLLAVFAGCGGNAGGGVAPNPNPGGTAAPSDPGTPPGTYTITVTGTSGAILKNSNVPVTVQ